MEATKEGQQAKIETVGRNMFWFLVYLAMVIKQKCWRHVSLIMTF